MPSSNGTGGGNWSVGATWAGGVKPADGETVTIVAGDNILMDEDASALTGFQTVTVQGHAITPGMLYWKDGTSGTLKIRTGYNLVGTAGAQKGRILINSDGDWTHTAALGFANKAIILLEGTSQINGTYLEARIFCTEPTNKFVRTYYDKYIISSINTGTNVITMSGNHGWAANRTVSVRSSGALPAPLEADAVYFVGSPSGADLKLLYRSSGAEVDLTDSGSGTIEIYSGYDTFAGVTTVNVLEDVTADTPWVNTAGHNAIALVDAGPADYDQQRLTLSSFNATTMTLSAALDSAQYPGAMIFLNSRNVSIRSTGTSTSQSIFTAITGSTINAEIKNTAGTGVIFYGHAFGSLSNLNTIGGVLSGLYYGINGSHFNTIIGIILTSNTGVGNANRNTISGIIAGCSNGLQNTINRLTSTGLIIGCTSGSTSNIGGIIEGTITKCNYGIGSTYQTLTPSGLVSGCQYGLMYPVEGVISGTIKRNTQELMFPNLSITKAVLRNVSLDTSLLIIYLRNQITGVSGKFSCENLNRVDGTHKVFDIFGDIIKTACDGTGDAPSVDPDGGTGYCIEASNIQSNCNSYGPLNIFENFRIWVSAGSHTITFKIQTTYAGITAGNLKLICKYIGTDGIIEEVHDDPAIAQRSDNTDWTQELTVSFTSSVDGWATLQLDLMEYQSGDEVYVWPVPVIT